MVIKLSLVSYIDILTEKNKIDTFIERLEECLDRVSHENKQVLIYGDLNVDGLKISTNDKVADFFNMVMSHDVIPKITLPTRIISFIAVCNKCTLWTL